MDTIGHAMTKLLILLISGEMERSLHMFPQLKHSCDWCFEFILTSAHTCSTGLSHVIEEASKYIGILH